VLQLLVFTQNEKVFGGAGEEGIVIVNVPNKVPSAWIATGDDVRAVAFDDLGKSVRSASVVQGGHSVETVVIGLWPTEQEGLIANECSWVSRNFSIAEWQQYFGDEPYHKTCPNLP
jgi:hypothetical protein